MATSRFICIGFSLLLVLLTQQTSALSKFSIEFHFLGPDNLYRVYNPPTPEKSVIATRLTLYNRSNFVCLL